MLAALTHGKIFYADIAMGSFTAAIDQCPKIVLRGGVSKRGVFRLGENHRQWKNTAAWENTACTESVMIKIRNNTTMAKFLFVFLFASSRRNIV